MRGTEQTCEQSVNNFSLLDPCNDGKSSKDAASGGVQLATMVAQQAVAKRSVGRRVTHLDAPFFWFGFGPALRAFTSLTRYEPSPKRLRRFRHCAALMTP
jgi:hypothetical protein